MSDDLDDVMVKIPSNDRDELHHLILSSLAQYQGAHRYKAGILFMEAVTEMKTAIAQGEFAENSEGAHVFVLGCEALANEAAEYLNPETKRPG